MIPVFHRRSWRYEGYQLLLMGVIFIFIWFTASFKLVYLEDSIFMTAVIYAIYYFITRMIITHNHRKGIKLAINEKYNEAIKSFEASYNFFTKNLWLDKYRFIFLASSSNISYREMALCNIGLCFKELGFIDKSKEYLQRALDLFPNSEIAEKSRSSNTSVQE